MQRQLREPDLMSPRVNKHLHMVSSARECMGLATKKSRTPMKINIAMNSTWYIWPTLQFMPSHRGGGFPPWPWLLTLWWANRGIQLEGQRPTSRREVSR